MDKLLTYTQYAELDHKSREEYIKKRLDIQDLWIIGKIRIVNTNNIPLIFIDLLINPYNGQEVDSTLFHPNKARSIKCTWEKGHTLKDNTTVLVKFDLVANKNDIEQGKIFDTTLKHVHKVNLENADKILDVIGVTTTNLLPVNLVYPNVYLLSLSRLNVQNFLDQSNQLQKEHLDQQKQVLLETKNLHSRIELEKQELNELKNILNFYGFNANTEEISTSSSVEGKIQLPSSLEQLIDYLQSELSFKSLIYEKATLRRLLRSLKTEQMIVLCGPSGTGKTTLVTEMANTIKANVEVIPVQPNWTDKQDLFGFYNPIRRLYVSSPFLDCLIRANQNPDKLHIICLDEMNLAQIEYYLADFLSLKETSSGQLRLYSEFEYKQNKQEINWYLKEYLKIESKDMKGMNEINPSLHADMISRHENLKRYPDKINIPNNIRIIGTMNVEGQVQSLSPKVTDRSYIIPLYKQKAGSFESNVRIKRVYNIPASYFNILEFKKTALLDEIQYLLAPIIELLNELGLDYNSRYDSQVLSYINSDLDADEQVKCLADDILLMKILPRIHESVLDSNFIDRLEQLIKDLLDADADSLKKLELMKKQYTRTSLYSYWS